MKTEIDRDLVKQVTNCLNEKSDEKKRNFVFVHGTKESVLVIDKKRLGAGDIKAAQKKADDTKFYKGVCFGELPNDGTKTLVFIVRRREEGLDRKLRQAIKENAGISCRVEVREPAPGMVGEDGELLEINDKTPDNVSVPKQPTQEQKDIANKAMYKKMLARVSGLMGALQKYEPVKGREFAEKAAPLLARAEELVAQSLPANQRDYKKALEILTKLKGSIPVANTKKPLNYPGSEALWNEFSAKLAPDAECTAKLRTAALLIKKLADTAGRFPVVEEARALYRQASQASRLLQFEEAVGIASALVSSVQQVLTRSLSCARVMHLMQETRDPEFSPVDIDVFDTEIETAMRLTLPNIPAALGQVEDRMRQSISDRGRFLESAKAVQALLEKGRNTLGEAKIRELQAAYQAANEQYQTVGASAGFDAMSKVDAQVRAAARLALDGISNPQPLQQQTPEARQLRIAMNVQNMRRSVMAIARQKPERAKVLSQVLDKLLKGSETNLDLAEAKLVEVQALVKKDLQETRETGPRIGLNRRRRVLRIDEGVGTGGVSTVEWSRQIDEGNLLSRMTIGREVARGGYGVVNFVDPNPEEDAPPLIIKVPTELGTLAGLEQEGNIYARIGDHPNLVKCLGIRTVGGQQGLVLERVQGRTVRDYMQNLNQKLDNGELSESEYWSTIQYSLKKTMETLAFLHDKGVGHNDLKPGNVMIDEKTGELKIIDLGTVNPLGARVEGVDSPDYRAPEDFDSHTSSPQTDVFAAGATAYAAILERKTFHYGNEEMMDNKFVVKRSGAVKEYGTTDTDEGAFPSSEENRTEEERRSSMVEQHFRDLMNAILHPDPAKRLSPKQALDHPFLNESLLDDDQVKAVIQRLGQDTLED